MRNPYRPHDLGPGDGFLADALYIDDGGRVYCGRHIGTEAMLTPWAWSCVGRGPVIDIPGFSGPITCETCDPERTGTVPVERRA